MSLVKWLKDNCPRQLKEQLLFFRANKRFINRWNPKLMDEKLLALKKEYYRREDIPILVDKYRVRKYLQENGLDWTLNELYQACDTLEEINWVKLPEKYVIKCNHGSGMNIVVDNSNIDKHVITKQLTEWLDLDYSTVAGEMQYKTIPPKIIIEKFLETSDGHFPLDYKFFTSWGEVIGCLVCAERDTKVKRIFVDTSFEDMHFIHEYEKEDYKKFKPESWNEMLKVAAELGKDFPFVRVDVYDLDGKVVFGELTFTPNGCINEMISLEGQKYIGERIHLQRNCQST